jgi:hypothetical protein
MIKKCTLYFFFRLFFLHSCNIAFYNPFIDTYVNAPLEKNQVATPVMSPVGGTYSSGQSVTITCSISGATIYYTTDGSDPDEDSTEYSSPVPVAGDGMNITIKAIAMKEGMLNSTISSESYIIQENYTIDWSDSVNITIDAHTLGLDGDVAQFPLLVRLNTLNFTDITTKTESGGADIRFAGTDETHLYYEIEDWVNNTSGAVWVLVDNISSSSQTTIKMYYNNPGVMSQSNPNAVFSTGNDFTGVWHLHQNCNDSTSNGNNGTNNGTTDTGGVIGNARSFTMAAGDHIMISGLLGQPSKITISAWVNFTDEDTNGSDVLSLGDSVKLAAADGPTSNVIGQYYRGTGWIEVNALTGILSGGWKYITYVLDPAVSPQRIYIDNGEENINGTIGSITYTLGVNTYIGKDGNGDTTYDFGGKIDEVRVSGSIRTEDWIVLNYESQKSGSTLVAIVP